MVKKVKENQLFCMKRDRKKERRKERKRRGERCSAEIKMPTSPEDL